MKAEVNLKKFEEGLNKLKRYLSPAQIKAIQKKTLKRAAVAGRTEASKRIRMEYNIRKRDLDKYLYLNLTGLNQGIARIIAASKRIPLIYFASKSAQKPRPKTRTKSGKTIKPYVKVKVKKKTGYKVLKRAFTAKMKSGHTGIFIRKGKGRLPIEEIKGPSVPQLLGARSVLPSVMKRIKEVAMNTLKHEVEYRIKKKLSGPS